MKSSIYSLTSELKKLSDKLCEIEPRISLVENRVGNIEDDVKNLKSNTTLCKATNSSNPESVILELNERARRSHNIMIHNLEESADGAVSNRIKYDLELVAKLCQSLHPPLTPDGVKAYRVGQKKTSKPRPLKVVMPVQADVT